MRRKISFIAILAALSIAVAAPSAAMAGPGNLIAPTAACPGQTNLAAPAEAQEQAMRCMTDFARLRTGMDALSDAPELDASAAEKSADILRCDSFSHDACGREFTYWIDQAGYMSAPCWHVGEDLAWGTGAFGTVRAIFRAWMRSPDHRRNILGDYRQMGVGLLTGDLEGQGDTQVWTAHFGSHCEDPPAEA